MPYRTASTRIQLLTKGVKEILRDQRLNENNHHEVFICESLLMFSVQMVNI